MTDTTAAEVGLFAVADAAERIVEGLLMPYNELSRTSASGTPPIAFAPGTVSIPTDPDVVTLNDMHDRFAPMGRAIELIDRPERGVFARFRIARTPEGDAYLANPTRKRLSPELAGIRRNGQTGLTARITGAGLVDEGAWESAALFALGDVAEVEQPEQPDEQLVEPQAAGETAPPAADQTTDPTDPEPDEPAEPANPAGGSMPTAPAPEHVTSAADAAAEAQAEQLGANAVFRAMTAVMHGNDPGAEAETMLAALADIKHSGTGALPAAGVLQPAWIGEVWQGRTYRQKFITLLRTGTIKALEQHGYKLTQGTALVKAWSGNKAELPTGSASTSLVKSTLRKYGFAVDVAGEFFDLPGGEQLIAAFWRGVVNSFAKIIDVDALADIVAAAGTPIAPDAYPDGYAPAIGMLIQGIEAVEDVDDSPTFAIANPLAWKQMLYTPHEQVPEFVKFAFGTDRTGTADEGKIVVVRGDVGIANTPAVIVGSRAAGEFLTLGGDTEAPITADALNIAKHGVDKSAVGYLQSFMEYPESIVLVGTADSAG